MKSEAHKQLFSFHMLAAGNITSATDNSAYSNLISILPLRVSIVYKFFEPVAQPRGNNMRELCHYISNYLSRSAAIFKLPAGTNPGQCHVAVIKSGRADAGNFPKRCFITKTLDS